MKEIKIITKGCPNLEHLPKNEAKVFYSTVLSCVIEHYADKDKSDNKENLTNKKLTEK